MTAASIDDLMFWAAGDRSEGAYEVLTDALLEAGQLRDIHVKPYRGPPATDGEHFLLSHAELARRGRAQLLESAKALADARVHTLCSAWSSDPWPCAWDRLEFPPGASDRFVRDGYMFTLRERTLAPCEHRRIIATFDGARARLAAVRFGPESALNHLQIEAVDVLKIDDEGEWRARCAVSNLSDAPLTIIPAFGFDLGRFISDGLISDPPVILGQRRA